MPHVLIGEIHNHTHRLHESAIHETIEQWVLSHGGAAKYGEVHQAFAAPADDPKLLKQATRAWRDAPGRGEDFTQEEGHKMYWFGFTHGPSES
ncbi:MAG: hypothetical protein R3185_05485 [Candidatus Thermoplasmatota archaeon]|nr:hypothetical protein [Candidatus Thermoplasmatota archaeon]